MSLTATGPPVTVAELVATIDQQRHGSPSPPLRKGLAQPPVHANGASARARVLIVVGAHPGAGASTVALALADATALRDLDGDAAVRLVDTAPYEASGLICAAERELGPGPGGWLVGRRGRVEIHRPGASMASTLDLPAVAPSHAGRLVVDGGGPLPDLQAWPLEAISRLLPHASLVVVCRSTIPGVRRAERVLADLARRRGPRRPIVVGVGGRRWPGPVRATFGPCMTRAHENGRIVLFPADRRLEVNGIDADPLPRSVTAAAVRLLDLVWPAPETPVPSGRG